MRRQKTDRFGRFASGEERKTERSVSLSSVFSNLCLLDSVFWTLPLVPESPDCLDVDESC
ncbi:MAG: hypothetical protein LBD06_02865 [Candidatus Accumulibacter sp.]|nr:hypothetical protein [Accumulibacter sp.]